MVLGDRVWSVSKFKSFEKYSTVVIYDKVASYQTIEIFGSKILKKYQKFYYIESPKSFYLIAILKFHGIASQFTNGKLAEFCHSGKVVVCHFLT